MFLFAFFIELLIELFEVKHADPFNFIRDDIFFKQLRNLLLFTVSNNNKNLFHQRGYCHNGYMISLMI